MEVLTAILAIVTSPGGIGGIVAISIALISRRTEKYIAKRNDKREQLKIQQESAKQEHDQGFQFRNELREDLSRLREELRATEAAADEWKSKYFEHVQKMMITETELSSVKFKLERTQQELAETINKIKLEG